MDTLKVDGVPAILKRIKEGDRLFMLRQGEEPRGIIGSGYATSDGFEDDHWDDESRTSNYVEFRLDILVDYTKTKQILTRQALHKLLPSVHWDTPASGMSVPSKSLPFLEKLWSAINAPPRKSTAQLKDRLLPEELENDAEYYEGASQTMQSNDYERSPKARNACIKHWGTRCRVCDFSFGEKYGVLGQQYIHVHHLVPLSSIKKRYRLDPIKDLCPICPNCHAMIHRHPSEPLSIDALKALMGAPTKRRPSYKPRPLAQP